MTDEQYTDTFAILSAFFLLIGGIGCAKIINGSGKGFECPAQYREDVRNHIRIAESAFRAHGYNYRWDGNLTVRIRNTGVNGEPLRMGQDGNGVAINPHTGQWSGGYTTSNDQATYFIFAGTTIPGNRLLHEAARDILYDNRVYDGAEQGRIMRQCGVWGSPLIY